MCTSTMQLFSPGRRAFMIRVCATDQGILFIFKIHDRVSNSCLSFKNILQNKVVISLILQILSNNRKIKLKSTDSQAPRFYGLPKIQTVKKLRKSKATGPDRIWNEMFTFGLTFPNDLASKLFDLIFISVPSHHHGV